MTYWLSYGGGVNSTALAVLMCDGKFPQYDPWRILFSDTGDERSETYLYIRQHFIPYLQAHGRELEICWPNESVLERWERLKVTGSRLLRTCTEEAKIIPMHRYRHAHGGGTVILGIDASESHRRPDDIRPLVDANIDREECKQIILAAGLPVPVKSGCWHCPFMRVSQIVELARTSPCRFDRIVRLEEIATITHGTQPDGTPRVQWGSRPAREWQERTRQGHLFVETDTDAPCDCYDG